jgi:polyisoprenyl-phosphate glycosyltransferase
MLLHGNGILTGELRRGTIDNWSTMSKSAGVRASLCLVVPCYNEEEMLPAFLRQAVPQLDAATGGAWRIICVDDGSRDDTFAIMAREHSADRRISGIRLSRNFGHQAAVSVGLAFASGDYIGVIDCDLQDPIEVLIELYHKARREGLDVCYGIRGQRDASWFLRFAYRLYYRLIERLADHHWPRDAGDFCVVSDRCHQVLIALPEHSRMLRGLRSWVGFKQAGVSYFRPARLRGTSKYNIPKLIALALQGLIAFSNIPLRLASLVGIMMSCFSILFGLLVIINRFFPGFTIVGYWVGANPGVTTVLVFLAFVFSILFISIGIIGEYLIVLLKETKRRPTGIVESVLGDIKKNELASHVADLATVEPLHLAVPD